MIGQWKQKVLEDPDLALVPMMASERMAMRLVQLANTRKVANHIPRRITEKEVLKQKRGAGR